MKYRQIRRMEQDWHRRMDHTGIDTMPDVYRAMTGDSTGCWNCHGLGVVYA